MTDSLLTTHYVELFTYQARFTDHSYLRSGAETVLLGGTCAAVAFFVGGAVAGFMDAPPPSDLD